jgi:thymidylate synthase
MEIAYKPLEERTPDYQYRDRLVEIMNEGILAADTPQDVGAITRFGELPPMVFDIENGVPLITERNIGFWRKPIAEIIAFINGARTIDEIEEFGCKGFWSSYRGKGTKLGLAPDDMGPGSYGAVFHDYELPDGSTLNQFAQLIEQIKTYPTLRTLRVTNWRPDYTARGPRRKVIVAPCHGEIHIRILGGKLYMRMDQRSGDMPIGVPSNMIQYAALMLMICQVTGHKPGKYIHTISDAHIYENQVPNVKELIKRSPVHFPTLKLDPGVTNLFDFRPEHFEISDYHPHPAMSTIPFAS